MIRLYYWLSRDDFRQEGGARSLAQWAHAS